MTDFSVLVGKTLVKVEVGADTIDFVCDNGERFQSYHEQDCCEIVEVEDVTGDINDIIGSPILIAEEATSNENPQGVTKKYQCSFTWTFYKIDTAKGGVTIRWYGDSNGYYSERVDFKQLSKATS